MKLKIDIDCTPDEARAFLGLPEVKPIQDVMLAEMQRQATSAMEHLNPETVMKTVFPSGMPGLEDMQKMFWSAAMGGEGGGKKT